ncbi:neurogenic locus notch homolog protein 1-like [Lytechinus variegatus]|uniref:neurogenic locus notch homolog protein 1-like n=1 Tax=Lytechinus variegatus TaxID=7654 RepID=UPI001BB0E202|nr:neurogenic locus notch homolog protein 1-like [Lytechinus variegatus]XP_041453142.1 neurogenic locus notch homolog protein 1-like [Lytechinus variegatus]
MQKILWILVVIALAFITLVLADNDNEDDIDMTEMCPVKEFEDEKEVEETCKAPGHPCDSNPCQNGGTCYEKFGALTYYRCYCTQSWIGRHCENVSTKPKPERQQFPGRYIPCFANKFNKDGICYDDLYDF